MDDPRHGVNAKSGFVDNGIWPLDRRAISEDQFDIAEAMGQYFAGPPAQVTEGTDQSQASDEECEVTRGADGPLRSGRQQAAPERGDGDTLEDQHPEAYFDWGAVRAVRWSSGEGTEEEVVEIKREEEEEGEDDEAEDDGAGEDQGQGEPRGEDGVGGQIAAPLEEEEYDAVETPEALRQRRHAIVGVPGLLDPSRKRRSQ
eukprot:GHVU01017670.1.p4 GENE.GHVU01017670.1~~GHVU01017670.1.p4  ORF type:complete len:201 (+),score=42.22 GHVU01017670.1:1472-2074(+)